MRLEAVVVVGWRIQMPRVREEGLQIENTRLKRENELLRRELYLRKKVKKLEREDREAVSPGAAV